MDARQRLCADLKQLIVESLDLPVEADWITDDQPLFGRGLELDSVDAIELAVCVEVDYGIEIDDEEIGVFASVNTLADHIEAARQDQP